MQEFKNAKINISVARELTDLDEKHQKEALELYQKNGAITLPDVKTLKEKQEAGAAFFITQLFFENDSFYRFLEKKNHAGITLPVCAGIMPITSAKQLGTTVTLSGSSVPKELADIIATYGENPEDMRKAGIDYAIRQILDLKQHGADGIHIYSMNKPKTTRTIVEAIR